MKKWKYELGKEYVLFYRAHPTIKLKYSYGDSDFFKNVTSYENMDELLIAADLFISDYSSSFFDYSILGKPMICWAYDYDTFSKYRHLRIDVVKELYGGVMDEDTLLLSIKNIPLADVLKMTKEFQEKYVTVYGNSSKKVLDLIYSEVK